MSFRHSRTTIHRGFEDYIAIQAVISVVLRITRNVHADSTAAFAGKRLHFLDGEVFSVDVVDEIEKNRKIEHIANGGNVV